MNLTTLYTMQKGIYPFKILTDMRNFNITLQVKEGISK